MSEFKGTPGPLVMHRQPPEFRSGDGLDHSIQTEDGDVVALVALVDGSPYDLALWAAAPELLDVAMALVGCPLTNTNALVEARDLARAAISKAIGDLPA